METTEKTEQTAKVIPIDRQDEQPPDKRRIAHVAVHKAAHEDLPQFMAKMLAGREPNAHDVRGAILGSAVIADRNVEEFEARIAWLEHTWLWRMFHGSQRPKRTTR